MGTILNLMAHLQAHPTDSAISIYTKTSLPMCLNLHEEEDEQVALQNKQTYLTNQKKKKKKKKTADKSI